MVLSFVLMSILDPMVARRDLVLSLSNPQMMLVTPFNSSMVMTGKAAHSKFVRIVSLVLVLDSVDEVDLEVGVASEAVSVVVEASEVVEDLVVALEVVEALVAVMGELLVLVSMLEPLPHRPTLSPTMLLLALKEARRSMFET